METQVAQDPKVVVQPMSDEAKTIVTVLLLLFMTPVGVVIMWIWTKWENWVKWLITVIGCVLPIIIAIIFVTFFGYLFSMGLSQSLGYRGFMMRGIESNIEVQENACFKECNKTKSVYPMECIARCDTSIRK